MSRSFDSGADPAKLPTRWCLAAVVACVLALNAQVALGQGDMPPAQIVVRDGAIAEPLSGLPGDANRGRAIVASRQQGLCLLCHTGPFPEERFQGNLAPDLAGTGSRWTEAQLRLRVVDARRLNPSTIMPPYHRVEGLHRVGAGWQGQPVLTAQQVEDVVAFLATLRE